MEYCQNCGAEIDEKAEICPECGVRQIEEVSNWWYLLPIFLTWIGGLIAWALTRNDNPDKAKNFIIVGVIVFLLLIIVPAAIYVSA